MRIHPGFTWSSQFPLGVHAAACVCIGNALGAGSTAKAIVICKVVLALSGIGAATVKGGHEGHREHLSEQPSPLFHGALRRRAGCGSGHRHHLQQVGRRIHLHLGRVSQTRPDPPPPVSVRSPPTHQLLSAVRRSIVAIVSETLTVYVFVQFFDALLVRLENRADLWKACRPWGSERDICGFSSACPRGSSSAVGCKPLSPSPTWFPTMLLVFRWD